MLVAIVPVGAFAQAPIDEVDDREVTVRLLYVESMIDQQDDAANLWFASWMSFHLLATAVQHVAVGALDDGQLRDSAIVGGIGSVLGAITMLIPAYHSHALTSELSELPTGRDPDERRRRLRLAERLLERAADAERFRGGWLPHLGVAAWGIASSLFLWKALDAPGAAWRNLAGSLIVGELRIWTMPTSARDAWLTYQARF